ncbi:MAG: hypothetical protein MI867_25560 [Pseudomonadales bacterium]|nr:hypothetical protein [Pseudomonadales bacterium]
MRLRLLKLPVLFAVSILSSLPAWGVNPEILERGWKPSVELTGDGRADVAVSKMRQMADLQSVMLKNTEYHQQTQAFVDGMWASLERFDLRRFYTLLPEEHDGWRQLRVYGSRDGGLYRMGPEANVFTDGKPGELGDLEALIRAKEVPFNNNINYLLSGTLSVSVGELRWPSVVEATEETFRIVVEGDKAFHKKSKFTPDYRYVAKVHAMNSDLGDEDVAVIAPLWAAFPEMWDLLASLGQVQEVVVEDVGRQPFQHLSASFQLKPGMMEKRYPELADHLQRLSSLLKADMKIKNDHGTILSLSVDSETLMGSLEAYIQDGRLLPVDRGRVLVNTPSISRQGSQHLTASIDSTMDILGIVTEMKGVRADIYYDQHEEGAKISMQMTHVPDVNVKGFALGFMPTGLINMFMPGSIDELMREFLDVACNGNDGKGVVAEMDFRHQNGKTQVHFTNEFEGLDNFMVRIGMGIVSDRIIPDNDVSDDIRNLIFDTQDAFTKDLDQFAAVALN